MDLAEEIERQGLGVRVSGTWMGACFFADDNLPAESDNELQNMLDVVCNYANRWKLSSSKCGYTCSVRRATIRLLS